MIVLSLPRDVYARGVPSPVALDIGYLDIEVVQLIADDVFTKQDDDRRGL